MLRSAKRGELIRVSDPGEATGLYLVISPYEYNARANALVCCEVVASSTGYPYEVWIEAEQLYILSDHLKRIQEPSFETLGFVSKRALKTTQRMIDALIKSSDSED